MRNIYVRIIILAKLSVILNSDCHTYNETEV